MTTLPGGGAPATPQGLHQASVKIARPAVAAAVPRTTLGRELTLRGRVLILIAVLATTASWLSGDANARVAAALLASPVFVDFVCKQRRLDRVHLGVQTRRTTVGAPFLEELHVRSDARGVLRELLILEPRTARSGAAFVDRLLPGQTQQAPLLCRSSTRSHQLQRVFVVASTWPLGLWRVRAVNHVTAELVTEPARVPLSPTILRSVHDLDPALREARSLPGPEYHSLREYQPGEDARSVHAMRSAALGVLVRRITQGRMPRDVGVVLDLRRPPGRPLTLGIRRFEWSLGAVATLLELLRAQEVFVQVLVLGTLTAHAPAGNAAQVADFFTFLAEAAPSPYRPLEAGALGVVRACEQGYWVPAGGFLAEADLQALTRTFTVLGGEPE
jgi:uncharacterized protein (DUF58 family)